MGAKAGRVALLTSGSSRRQYAGNLTRFYVYRALVYSYFWMPFWVFYLQRMRHMSLTEIYVLGAVSWVASAVAEVPTGAVADVLGRRVSLAVGAFGYAVGVVGYVLSTSCWLLALFGVVWNLGFAFISGADLALVYDSLLADGDPDDNTKVAGRGSAVMHAAQGRGRPGRSAPGAHCPQPAPHHVRGDGRAGGDRCAQHARSCPAFAGSPSPVSTWHTG